MISKKDICISDRNSRILLRTNEFICLRPHPRLNGCVSNYNITFPNRMLMSDGFTVIPCGCAALSIEKNSRNLFVRLEGPSARPASVGSLTNQLDILITIEFKPAGLYALTGISQSELADQSISFDAVNPSLSKLISDLVEQAAGIYELAAGFDRLLLENMYTACHPQLSLSLQNIVDHSGNISVKKLSDDIHYSERQLNRIFKQHIGIGAKSFSRLIRINNTFDLLKKPTNSLQLISDIMGFHDLSHFIRDFKSVCGTAPQNFRNNMSDFYINPKKF